MVDIVISIAAKIAEYTVAPVGRWLCYSFNYKSNIQHLKNEEKELQLAKTRVEHSIDDALGSNMGHVIEDDVKAWLSEVNEITKLATRILREEIEVETRSSHATCLNLKHRHQLSRKANKIAGNIVKHLEKGKFPQVCYLPASQDHLVTTRDKNFVTLGSRTLVLNEIMELLGDSNINKIGVWGLPGVGKSTLMNEIERRAKEEKLFLEVFRIDVNKSPELNKIKGQIAILDEHLRRQTEIERSNLQQESPTKKSKMLVILDDIWKELDLEDIGIPSEGYKVVLTSRHRDVLGDAMGIKKILKLESLPEKEAWDLFEKMAGDCVEDSDVRKVAIKVAELCAGLPVALTTVAKALKGEARLCVWKDAELRLKGPRPEYVPNNLIGDVYNCIKLSYDHLAEDEHKSLFLLCALLGRNIYYQDLLRYGFGLGLFHGINTFEAARYRLSSLVCNLQDSCLLLESSDSFEKFYYMHDVVHDIGTIIAGSENRNMSVMGDDGGQKALPDADSLKRCEASSILGGVIDQPPNEMECPKLRFFHVYLNDRSLNIPDSLFKGLDNLSVLGLKKMELGSLPSSLLLLRNLRTLCLHHCVLEDISRIGELKNLVILSLGHSKISELPKEVGSLDRLRMLDLSNCSKLQMIPPNVLSSLGKLEELHMGNSFVQWESEGMINNERKNASLAELNDLPHLTALEIQIPDANNAPADLSLEKLERFIIFIGDIGDWQHDSDHTSRTLKVKFNPSFQPQFWVKLLWNGAEDLHLYELHGVENIIPEINSEGFKQLKNLLIQNSAQLKYILGSTASVIAFPKLETFILENMISLEEICHGKLPLTPFEKLRVLKVISCEKLRYVFSSSIVRGLPSLEVLEVRNCKNMFAIVVKEEGHGLACGDEISFPRLQTLELAEIPKLVSFLSRKTSFTRDGGEIISEGNHDPDMPLLHDQVALPNLKILLLRDLPKINHIWSTKDSEIPFVLEQLEEISIFDCGMEEIVAAEGRGEATVARSLVFPRVAYLCLRGVRRLKWFYKGMHISEWPMLECLEIDGCENVEILVSGLQSFQETVKERRPDHISSIKQPLFLVNEELSFPSLEKLYITRMEKLEIIWQDQVATTSMQSLTSLILVHCHSLETIFGKLESPKGNETPQALIAPESRTKQRVAKNYICMPLRKTLLCGEGILCQESTTKEDGATRHSTVASSSLQKQEDLPKQIPSRNEDPNTIFRFQNLQMIAVYYCENLRSVFTSSVKSCLMQLKRLWIENCGVEEIVSSVEGQGGEAFANFVFPQVTDLRLQELHRLKWFCKGEHVSKWPKLEKMTITKCDEVEILFAYGVLRFQKAVEERRSEMSIKQPLFLVDNDELSFPSLKNLEIKRMENLEIIWQDQVATSSFSNIQKLKISTCKKLETIFGKLEGPNGNETPLALIAPESRTKENVVIEDGGTRHLVSTVARPNFEKWESKDANTIFRFQNLQEIEVYGCYSLRCIFPTSAITCLKQLKRLEIKDCGMEEIVAVEGEGGEAVARFVFSQVTKLSLERLDRLKWFYKGVHVSKWPMLEEMWITKCYKVEIIASGVERFQETVGEKGSEMPIKQPLFLVDHDQLPFPSLKTLYIQDMDKLEIICQDQVAEMSFSNLQKLRIFGCQQLRLPIFQSNILTERLIPTELRLENRQSLETIFGKHEGQNGKETQALQSTFPNVEVLSLGFQFEAIWPIKFSYIPPSLLTRMPNLLELRVNDIGWEEIFPNELPDREIQVLILPRLRRLELSRLPMLTHLWKEDTQPCPLFHNLEFLSLSQCTKLRNLVPSSVFLGNLTDLRISNCHGLINLVTPSTARGLSQLKQMSVTKCKRITEIVAMEDGEAKFLSISFHKLEYLELEGLPNLTKFYSGRYFLFFPSLEKVIVSSCPEMKTFCQYAFDSHWGGHDLNITTHWLWELDHYDTGWLFRQSVENTKEDEDP